MGMDMDMDRPPANSPQFTKRHKKMEHISLMNEVLLQFLFLKRKKKGKLEYLNKKCISSCICLIQILLKKLST